MDPNSGASLGSWRDPGNVSGYRDGASEHNVQPGLRPGLGKMALKDIVRQLEKSVWTIE